MNIAGQADIEAFLKSHPEIQMLELMMPDINGILRCKRIHRREFGELFNHAFKAPLCTPLLGITGNLYSDHLDPGLFAGDPDQLLLPVAGTIAPIPWLESPTAQVLTSFADMERKPAWVDPRNVLAGVVERFTAQGLQPVVATELEFYLLAPNTGDTPRPLLGQVAGTSLEQQGIQYCMADDLMDCDAFLDDVRTACEIQSVPLTAIHSEFSAGQWEINTHHTNDPLVASDHAMLLRRIIKGVARKHGLGATFMAKPFVAGAGNGLHIHASVYDSEGNNIFAAEKDSPANTVSENLRHAIGGLAESLEESMAIFAPNSNSYRRFRPGAFAPSGPTWAHNHREVALRIPVSSEQNRRVEHRVSGADANPYLVVAAVLAGIHHGLTNACDPGPPVPADTDLSDDKVTLPRRWEAALQSFRHGKVLAGYLGETYCNTFAAARQGECDEFNYQVSNIDYQWYLRAI